MKIKVANCKPVNGGEGIKVRLLLTDSRTGEESEGALVISFDDYGEFSPLLKSGELSEEMFCVLEERSRRYTAYSKAVYLLSFGDCNRRQMIQKLIRRGIDRESAEYAADALCREELIDEFSQLHEKMLMLCREKYYGRRRIMAELYKKGYQKEDIRQAFLLFEGELDYEEARLSLLRRTFGTEEPDLSDVKTRQKYQRTLYSHGF